MDKVIAHIDTKRWEGWTEVSITRALKAVAGEIRLSITRDWKQAEVMPVQRGTPIKVDIGHDRVATGYISEFIPSYDSKEVRYELICFDKTIDLVECSVVHASGQWNNITLDALAREVCQPFGIDVVVETDVGDAFTTIRLEQGETAFELLERVARQRGVLLTSNSYGNLVITRASTEVLNTRLELGVNIRAARGRFSDRSRHSEVIVKGDGWSGSSDNPEETGGKQVTQYDKGVARYRPHILIMEEQFTVEGASRRGAWHIANAIAKSDTSEVTVSGWRMGKDLSGELWPLNKQVPVRDNIQQLDKDLLIANVSYIDGKDGRVTVLSVVPPESMNIEPVASKGKTDVSWKKPNNIPEGT